jgi:tetratricopeptide (TPR) repeat protein
MDPDHNALVPGSQRCAATPAERFAALESGPASVCPVCGAPYPAGAEGAGCPVCLLHGALGSEAASEGGSPHEGQSPPEAGRFEHYELVRSQDGTFVELGRGAMGVTYRATDSVLGRPVALKVIDARVAARPEARERFLREARAAARLHHPNVASVFYYGVRTGDGQCFYAMELVEGESVAARVRREGPLSVGLALEVVAQVARALAVAEAQGLVHRDLKPANLMLANGPALTVKVIDFGLAKAAVDATGEADLTQGGFVGTPAFASPEQCAGGGVDVRSDLYSLGVTLWTMLAGKAPFRGSCVEVREQHLHASLPWDQLQGLPQPLRVLLEALLEKDPARRFQTPAQLLQALPKITAAIAAGRTLTPQGLRKASLPGSGTICRKPPIPQGPEKISLARLPVTGKEIFGRGEALAFLDKAWAKSQVNVITIVAWAGVGKSTLVNHWLRRLAAKRYGSAERVFGWSFYRQGTGGNTASADEFVDAALTWFGDADPRLGTAWEKGGRLARLIARRRTLLILDGLEPLQDPPGPHEGRLREPALQALLRELAAFNRGLCVITTRLPVADLAEHEGGSALRLDLDHLSPEAGTQLLRALGVKGLEPELRTASEAFGGHCLALTLLGSYLSDAYGGDIRCREAVSGQLAHDVRQGAHARKVMDSYQSWLGEGPELSVLRILGLFDRPADENALGALLKPPGIPGLTESLTDLRPTEWRTILSKLRRARLLAGEDPHNPGQLDAHPLVREYFGEQLRSQQTDAWKECNRRLFHYYRTLAPRLPNSFREMEPLFLAVICGCNAGLYHDALHEIYIPRIQRGNDSFAANVLGARGPLLSVLVHFFEQGRWGSLVENCSEGQGLTPEDQLFTLMQAGLYLTATRGMAAPEARICYERAESLCESLNRPRLLSFALLAQWRYSVMTDKLSATIQIAKRVYSLAQEQNDAALMIGAYRALAATLFYFGDFESARKYAMCGLQIWRSEGVQSYGEEYGSPVVSCLYYEGLSEWHLGETASCHAAMADAISLAKELNDMNALTLALYIAGALAHFERNAVEVERLASDLIELSTRHNFALWLAGGTIFRGWARSTCGNTAEGIPWIEEGIGDWRATGAVLVMPFWLALKAEALYLAGRTPEALETIREAEAMAERSEERFWCAELHRLRGVFLAAIGADETQIEASFCEAIRIAKEQKSVSLEKRAEAIRAGYRRQKASASGGRGLRLPLS